MNRKLLALPAVVLIAAAAYVKLHEGSRQPAALVYPSAPPPGALPNFELFDTEGHAHELYRYADQKAIVLISFGADCPIVQKNAGAIRELGQRYAKEPVALLGLDAMPADGREEIRKETKAYGIDLPILRDTSQMVARELGFHRTSEAVVIDTRSWSIVYRGAIDDHLDYGANKGEAKNHYLRDAIDAVLRGGKPPVAETAGKGCAISFQDEGEAPTYVKAAGIVLRDKCLNCHSETGAQKPFFTDYASVKSWTAMIRETVMTQRMPIWGIDSEPGEFLNDNSLTPEQKRTLIQWIDAKAPRGEGADPLVGYVPKINNLPPAGAALVASTKVIDVPPDGFNEYDYPELTGPLERDMWVKFLVGVTTNPNSMHHANILATPHPLGYYMKMAEQIKEDYRSHDDGSVRPDEIWVSRAIYRDMKHRKALGMVTPNSPYKVDEKIRVNAYSAYGRNNVKIVPEGTAFFLPKGYYLFLEAHHEGTGRPEKEKTTLFFYETKKTPDLHALHELDQIALDAVIPPFAKNYHVDLPDFTAEKDMYVLGCKSHMHIRGREVQAKAVFPDGHEEHLFSIPSFLYTWHPGALAYFRKPRFLPKGTVIRSYAVLDNSVTNPFNPDPSQTVPFGATLTRNDMPKFQCLFKFAKE